MKAYELPRIPEVTIVQDGKSFTEDQQRIESLTKALKEADEMIHILINKSEFGPVHYAQLEKARKLSFFTIRPLINPEQK